MTIAEMRAREVRRLAEYKNPNPTAEDLAEAKRLMNSFYRLCGLCETNLYLANVYELYNPKTLEKSEEREAKWHKRLNVEFYEFCGLRLVYLGYCPSIRTVNEHGGFSEKISRFFYN